MEGVPTDSEALEQSFHSHGINMRYIGHLAKEIESKELNHLKTLLEREAVMRSCKHLFNEYLRETADTHLSSLLAHLFNLVLAPFPLLEKLEEGSITYQSSSKLVSLKEEEVDAAPKDSTEQKKKQKKGKKNDQKSSAAPADLGEMLLKQGGSSEV